MEVVKHVPPPMPSNRKFGLLFTLVFALWAGLLYYRGHPTSAMAAAAASGAFGVITLLVPDILRPLNYVWYLLSLALGKVVSPIVLSVIYFVVITPVAVVTRLFGRDELQLKKQSAASFWVEREPAGPEPESFRHPF